jgi:hypothetical protein
VAILREAVRYVRDVRTIVAAGRTTRVQLMWGDKPVDEVFPLGTEPEPMPPRPPGTAPDVPPGWGFD